MKLPEIMISIRLTYAIHITACLPMVHFLWKDTNNSLTKDPHRCLICVYVKSEFMRLSIICTGHNKTHKDIMNDYLGI